MQCKQWCLRSKLLPPDPGLHGPMPLLHLQSLHPPLRSDQGGVQLLRAAQGSRQHQLHVDIIVALVLREGVLRLGVGAQGCVLKLQAGFKTSSTLVMLSLSLRFKTAMQTADISHQHSHLEKEILVQWWHLRVGVARPTVSCE